MPFDSNPYTFNEPMLNTVNEVGAVYGLFQQVGIHYIARYVGMSDNLRRRLHEHYNNPPISGCTHFFAEVIPTELRRISRERELIKEFNPPGNTQLVR